jgi:diaminopropionate ammonia-lyase
MAAALQGYLVQRFGARRPKLVVVEPTQAACFYLSILRGDGRRHIVTGPMPTLMAGLACGEPSILAWRILRDWTDVFVACPDGITITGMQLLAKPLAGDPALVSGESGAVTLGLVHAMMTEPALEALKAALELNEQSRILLFSTEGDTDPDRYKEITTLS